MKHTPTNTQWSAEELNGKTVLFKFKGVLPLHGDFQTIPVSGGFVLRISHWTKRPERIVRNVLDDEVIKIQRNETGETDFIMI